ncbi:MAG: hypothetical protein U1F43_00875 [Myxococcota bacterium]
MIEARQQRELLGDARPIVAGRSALRRAAARQLERHLAAEEAVARAHHHAHAAAAEHRPRLEAAPERSRQLAERRHGLSWEAGVMRLTASPAPPP